MEHLSQRLLSWASLIDEQTLAQAHTTSHMPFIFPHLALMPDAHLGKGATVGSVIPTLGAIIPAAVGVDIGPYRPIAVRPEADGDRLGACRPGTTRRVRPRRRGVRGRRRRRLLRNVCADAVARTFDHGRGRAVDAHNVGQVRQPRRRGQ